MSLYAFSNALTIGAILSLLALGLYISFRIVRFPDLTCDGSYALGACATVALLRYSCPAWLTPVTGFAVGFLAGVATGLMYSRLKFPHVVSGIIVMTGAYSVNLLMMRVPNVSIPVDQSLYAPVERAVREWASSSQMFGQLLYPALNIVVAAAAFFGMWYFLISEIGLRWRCVGANPQLARRNGMNPDLVVPLGLGLANGLIGLAGCLFAHYQRFADVNMGVGIIMVGLASVFLGQAFETVTARSTLPSLARQLSCVFLGALAYRMVVSLAYELGLPTSLFNLTTASLVFLALLSPGIRRTWVQTFTRNS